MTFDEPNLSLLNLRPNFVSSKKTVPFMGIIAVTKSVALNLEYHKKEADPETLR